jgi:hypothetical protein
MLRKSYEHLKNNNMNYGEHLIFAFLHAIRCLTAGFMLVLHGVVPGIFTNVGSILITKLSKDFTITDENNKRTKT